MSLSPLIGFVFSLISNGTASFKPIRYLGFSLEFLHRPLVCISPGAFFFLQTFVIFLRFFMVIMSGNSRSVLHSHLNT